MLVLQAREAVLSGVYQELQALQLRSKESRQKKKSLRFKILSTKTNVKVSLKESFLVSTTLTIDSSLKKIDHLIDSSTRS